MKFSKSLILMFFSVFSLIFSVGCGGGGADDQPELGTVTGVVTMDGQPLANVVVSFEPAQGRPSIGKTDDSGKYELGYLNASKGAVIGSHTVSISTPQEAPTPAGQAYKDPIPAKYNSKTTLKGEVKAGDNTINFDLTSK
ncbi:MAG: hypothetical protein KDA77_11095 [Planctomycetaceae bacterium]|nr:hypothetical protein [Planctomycetaceae bacterium]